MLDHLTTGKLFVDPAVIHLTTGKLFVDPPVTGYLYLFRIRQKAMTGEGDSAFHMLAQDTAGLYGYTVEGRKPLSFRYVSLVRPRHVQQCGLKVCYRFILYPFTIFMHRACYGLPVQACSLARKYSFSPES